MVFKAYLENKRNTSKAISPFEMIVWFILLYLFLGSIYIHALICRCWIILYCWKESNLIIAYSLLMFWIQLASIFIDLFGVCVCLCTYVYLYTRQFVISWDQTEAIKLDHECLVLSFQPLGSLVLEWGFLYLCSSRKLDSFYVRVMLALKSEFWQNPFETYLFDRALKELCLIVLHLEFIT